MTEIQTTQAAAEIARADRVEAEIALAEASCARARAAAREVRADRAAE